MIHAIQRVLIEMGEAACYFLVLCLRAQREGYQVDVVQAFQVAVDGGLIHYNADNPDDPDNCFIEDAGAVYSLIAGGRWNVSKEAADYVPKTGEFAIARYERKTTKGVYGHFVGLDSTGKVIDDPMGESLTVAKGERVSTRILRRA